MKGSIEIKSLKILDVGTFKCSLQLGWAFMTAVIVFILMFAVARASFTADVQEQFYKQCVYEQTLEDQTVKQLYPATWENYRRDVLGMCKLKRRSDANIAFDYKAWSYSEVYGDKRFKN